jgi:capsule polysaccharide modification protein KpsS
MHIDRIYFPVRIWENYYHNSKRTNNKMNVVNTRTNILYIHGCHTRTNHKKNVSCYSCKSHPGNIQYHHSKPTFRCQNFLEKIHAWFHEDMQQVKLGGMLGLINVLFSSTFPFIILHISSPH